MIHKVKLFLPLLLIAVTASAQTTLDQIPVATPNSSVGLKVKCRDVGGNKVCKELMSADGNWAPTPLCVQVAVATPNTPVPLENSPTPTPTVGATTPTPTQGEMASWCEITALPANTDTLWLGSITVSSTTGAALSYYARKPAVDGSCSCYGINSATAGTGVTVCKQ